jgi:hypothetical protein
MRVILSAMVVCSLVGCGKKKEEPKATTETKGVSLDTSKPGPAAPTPAAAATSVDTCSFVSKEDMEKLLGGPLAADPEKQEATGSFLGGCNFTTAKGPSAMVSARPAGEFDATAGGDAKDVPGVGEKAKMTKYGLLVLPAGKSYFMQVMVMDGTKTDETKSIELGKLAAAGAK